MSEELVKKVTILTAAPTVVPIAQMSLMPLGIEQMMGWVGDHRPECLPDDASNWKALFPHDLEEEVPPQQEGGATLSRGLTANELLVELAGRKCYDSFGLKAGKKGNKEYIQHTQSGPVKHSSILYHAKMSFFFGGISRRVSHEIIRNYVGADRDEEGSPSQESTRFTHHYGFFIMPPRYLDEATPDAQWMQDHFERAMQTSYDAYCMAVNQEVLAFEEKHGKKPTSLDKKRIYEAASSFLPHQAETSFVWTTNPMAIAKMVQERADNAADLEIQRFARTLRRVAVENWPNLFPQPWMGVTD
jgi:thymidylate synthase (FAD)